MNARALAVAASVAATACAPTRCDDFVTLSLEVGSHGADPCSLFLANANAATSARYDFAAPTAASTCDGGACTRSVCTAISGPAPSFCTRMLDAEHDRILIQLEGATASALATYLGSRDFAVSLTCGGETIPGKTPAYPTRASVDCIEVAR